MSAEENIQLMRRWFEEVWNEGRIQTVYELLSADAVARDKGARKRKFAGRKSS